MMKKITFFLMSLVCAMSVMAYEYTGTISVNSSTFSETKENVISTITETSPNTYTLHFDEFAFGVMGYEVDLGVTDFEDLKGTTGKDGYTTASGTKQISFDQIFGGFDLSSLFGGLGGLGGLFGGLDFGSLFGNMSFPMMVTTRFNDREITANIIINIALGFGGSQLMDETVTIYYEGVTTAPITPDPDPALYLIGSFNNWDEENMLPLTLDNGVWTITQAMEENAEFKLKDEKGNWIGGVSDGNFIVTREQVENGTELSLAVEGGMNFQMPVAGEWTLAVDKENMKMVISGEWNEPVVFTDVYILGEVNDNSWAPNVGLAMATEDGITYTADIAADGRNDGFNYFSFTTKLADNGDDWDGIEPYRFGAVSEGDFWVTDDMFDKELELTSINGQAFKIATGDYSLTLNLENYTLVIVNINPGVRGDVDGNGIVDVNDVSIAIDIILGTQDDPTYIQRADVDGNGIVDVADVSDIIDIVLGK